MELYFRWELKSFMEDENKELFWHVYVPKDSNLWIQMNFSEWTLI